MKGLVRTAIFVAIFESVALAMNCDPAKPDPEIRLDQDVLKDSVMDQDGLGTCYAFAASTMLKTVLPGNPTVSPLHLAALQAAYRVTERLQNLPDSELLKIKNKQGTFDLSVNSSTACNAFVNAKTGGGVCPRDQVKLEQAVRAGKDPSIQGQYLEKLERWYSDLSQWSESKSPAVSASKNTLEAKPKRDDFNAVLKSFLTEMYQEGTDACQNRYPPSVYDAMGDVLLNLRNQKIRLADMQTRAEQKRQDALKAIRQKETETIPVQARIQKIDQQIEANSKAFLKSKDKKSVSREKLEDERAGWSKTLQIYESEKKESQALLQKADADIAKTGALILETETQLNAVGKIEIENDRLKTLELSPAILSSMQKLRSLPAKDLNLTKLHDTFYGSLPPSLAFLKNATDTEQHSRIWIHAEEDFDLEKCLEKRFKDSQILRWEWDERLSKAMQGCVDPRAIDSALGAFSSIVTLNTQVGAKVPLEDLIHILIRAGSQPYELLDNAWLGTCAPADRIQISPSLSCKDMVVGDLKGTASEKQTALFSKVSEVLAQGQATTASVCMDFLSDSKSLFRSSKPKKDCGGYHEMALIGQRCRGGKAEYLIQNSWGSESTSYLDKNTGKPLFAVEGGRFWISESQLFQNLDGLSYMYMEMQKK